MLPPRKGARGCEDQQDAALLLGLGREALRRRAGSELADVLFAHLRHKRAAALEHLAQADPPAPGVA